MALIDPKYHRSAGLCSSLSDKVRFRLHLNVFNDRLLARRADCSALNAYDAKIRKVNWWRLLCSHVNVLAFHYKVHTHVE